MILEEMQDASSDRELTIASMWAEMARREGHRPKLPKRPAGGSGPQQVRAKEMGYASVINVLCGADSLTCQEVSLAADLSHRTTRDYLYVLIGRGQVSVDKSGVLHRYALVESE